MPRSIENRGERCREELLSLMRRVLKTGANLNFPLELDSRDLETLIGCIRNRINQAEGNT